MYVSYISVGYIHIRIVNKEEDQGTNVHRLYLPCLFRSSFIEYIVTQSWDLIILKRERRINQTVHLPNLELTISENV